MTTTHSPRCSFIIIATILVLTISMAAAQDDRSFNITTEGGLIAMNLNTDGYNGSFLSSPYWPSLEYPAGSNVQHLYHAGLWIGIRSWGDHHRVSTAAEDANSASEAGEIREFQWDEGTITFRSNQQNSEHYHPQAIATWEAHYAFEDNANVDGHAPLGLRVETRVLAWAEPHLDDSVVLEYTIINQSDETRYDIYVGYYTPMPPSATRRSPIPTTPTRRSAGITGMT